MKLKLLTLCLTVLAYSLSAQTPRLSLFEEFTGETCPPCASTNPALNATLSSVANATKIVAIKWQVPIPSAPVKTWSLYQTNKAEIDWRYKATGAGYGYPSQTNSTSAISSGINSAPSGRIDGQHQWAFGAASDHPANISNAVIATAQSYTSAFSITMARAWNKNCTAVTLTITVQATAPFTSVGNLVFRTVMVERLIQFSVQPGTNGETIFEDVAIKSFPTIQGGTSLPNTWTLGQSQTFTLNCPLPSYTRKKEEVAFVGFIQDDGNKKVAQACRADKVALPTNALAGVSAKADLTCTNLISPTVTIKNDGTLTAITALTLTPYIDGVVGTLVPWTGNLAVGASTNIVLSSLNSSTVSGSHTFSCELDMSNTFNLTKNATKINYMVATNFSGNPVAEGFVGGAYPPPGFGVINLNGGPSWSRNTNAGAYNISPLQSSMYDFYNNTVIGDQDELYLPPLNLTGSFDTQLNFDVAYAQRSNISDDALDILVSDNCGANWTNVYNSHGTALATTAPIGSPYSPDPFDPSNWKTESVDLSAFQNKANVLVKFVTTSDNGNNLFLDNINLGFKITGISNLNALALNVALYPNPSNGTTSLKITSLKSENAKVSLLNTLGQVVYSKQVSLNEGATSVLIDVKEYASGIYTIVIDSNNGSVTKKLTVIK